MFDGRPEIELGWVITPERWGEGLATELGQASVDVAFGQLGLPELVAFTTPGNVASRRVMEKLGFAYEKTAPFMHYGEHVLYRLRSVSSNVNCGWVGVGSVERCDFVGLDGLRGTLTDEMRAWLEERRSRRARRGRDRRNTTYARPCQAARSPFPTQRS